MDDVKILWLSNAPWASTGYGTQTAQMLPRLRDAGHDVAVFANYGLNGAMFEWDGFHIYPSGFEQWGNDVVGLWARDWFKGDPGLVLTLYDTWVLDPKAYDGLVTACWTPVDHSPVPPKVLTWFEQSGAYPIAMSRFGEESLSVNGLAPLYAPHGIDVDAYRPHPKDEAKRLLGLPRDRFIVGMVSTNNGANPSRKAFDVAFRSFKALSDATGDALLYVHAEAHGRYARGVDLVALASTYGIKPDELIFADQTLYRTGSIDAERMAYIYSAFDVLSFASMGEGFGLPALEAQACGTPVIVTDFSAQRELCGAGWKVKGQLWFDAHQGADFCLPYDFEVAAALAEAYDARGDVGLQEKARAFAEDYDADLVFDRDWRPILDYLEQVVVP